MKRGSGLERPEPEEQIIRIDPDLRGQGSVNLTTTTQHGQAAQSQEP